METMRREGYEFSVSRPEFITRDIDGVRSEPVGVDMANWVRTYQSWRGHVDIDDVVMPPAVPFVAGVVDALVGLRWTSHALMAFGSVLPAAAVWWVLRAVPLRP